MHLTGAQDMSFYAGLAAMTAGPLAGAMVSYFAERTVASWSGEAPPAGRPAGSHGQIASAVIVAVAIVAVCLWAFHEAVWAIIAANLGFCFLYSALIDVRLQLLPHWPSWLCGLIAVTWHWRLAEFSGLGSAALGAAIAGGSLGLLAWIYYKRLGAIALGFGDIQLAAAGGALVGPADVWGALTVAAIVTGAWGLMLKRGSPSAWRTSLAFGPGLMAAFWFAWARRAAGL